MSDVADVVQPLQNNAFLWYLRLRSRFSPISNSGRAEIGRVAFQADCRRSNVYALEKPGESGNATIYVQA